MLRRSGWWWVVLLAAALADARPVAVLVAPDRDLHRAGAALGKALLDDGGLADADVVVATSADDVAGLGEDPALPRITAEDTLTALVAGTTRLDAQGQPSLVAGGEAVPLEPLLALFCASEAKAVNLLVRLEPAPGTAAVDLTTVPTVRDAKRPVAVVQSRHERFLVTLAAGLTALLADDDADGLVDVGELHRWVSAALGPKAATLTARPSRAGTTPVAGLGGPDTLAPLVLVMNPRLRDDGPVLLDRPGALVVQGIVADNRRIREVTVNAIPATLSRATDPALEGLGYPGRTWLFEAAIPVAPTGFTEVVALTRDVAGNLGEERFMVLTAGLGPGPTPGATEPRPDSVDAVAFDWGVTEDWRFGFRVKVDATVHGLKGRRCRAAVQFRFRGGDWLQDINGQFSDDQRRVTAYADFTPQYDHAVVRGVPVFVPQRELHLAPGRGHAVEAVVTLVDASGPLPDPLVSSAPFPFDLTEPDEAATVYDFKVEHNVRRDLQRGLLLRTRFDIAGLQSQPCQLAVYFQRADGRQLLDTNARYRAADGSVAAFADFNPPYPSADYRDYQIFLPYDELDLPAPAKYTLRARAVVWDRRTMRALDASAWVYFTVTRN